MLPYADEDPASTRRRTAASRAATSTLSDASATRTRCPRRASSSVRWDPMNPAPPVTRYAAIALRSQQKLIQRLPGPVDQSASADRSGAFASYRAT